MMFRRDRATALRNEVSVQRARIADLEQRLAATAPHSITAHVSPATADALVKAETKMETESEAEMEKAVKVNAVVMEVALEVDSAAQAEVGADVRTRKGELEGTEDL